MSVLVSGVLLDGTSVPLSGYQIILRAQVNTQDVVMCTEASVTTSEYGEYEFSALQGKYWVYLKSPRSDECCVGEIIIDEDAHPGTLNDFLTALTEADLKPDVVKRFEAMVAQAQKSAEQAQQSAELAGQHAELMGQLKGEVEGLAEDVRQHADEVVKHVAQVQQEVQLSTEALKGAQEAAKTSEMSARVSKDCAEQSRQSATQAQVSAEHAVQSEQNALRDAQSASLHAQHAEQYSHVARLERDDAERFAQDAEQSAQASGAARDESVKTAVDVRLYHDGALSAATSAELAANSADGHERRASEWSKQAKDSQVLSAKSAREAKEYRDSAQQIVEGLNSSDASTTQKGLVQLSNATDSESEERAATPKAVKIVMDETKTKAPLDSPALTGTPTTPTPPDDAAGLEMANAEFVRNLIAALVDSSPEVLDTLNELAAALGNDPNFATTVTNALAGKQPLNDVLTAVSQITPKENTLPYFSAEGRILLTELSKKARTLLAQDTPEAMRTALELKAAATMNPQNDIRDRTSGRLALSGMHGFGQVFSNTEALAFEGQADFARWLEEVTPGRYAVSIPDTSSLLAGTTKFNGIIDVMWSPFDNDRSDTKYKFKTLLCFNQYEHSIHRMTYRWSGNSRHVMASPIIYDGDSLAFLLSQTAGNGPYSYYKYPAIGVPIIAVYQGKSFGADVSLGLGDIVPGSRLGPLAMSAPVSDTGTYASTPKVFVGGAGAYNFPGRYMALSGSRSVHDERLGYIGLFVRIE
ncbi:TPA: prophage tail fiber N-terminal domain-containing protein [Providencia alcalifaciens]